MSALVPQEQNSQQRYEAQVSDAAPEPQCGGPNLDLTFGEDPATAPVQHIQPADAAEAELPDLVTGQEIGSAEIPLSVEAQLQQQQQQPSPAPSPQNGQFCTQNKKPQLMKRGLAAIF